MTKYAYITPQCCKRPSIAVMDHDGGLFGNHRAMVSRMCLNCGQHWYGEADAAVVEFNRAAWERYVNEVQP